VSPILVVAFDGMDKQLVERYDLGNIVQSEFGSIDKQDYERLDSLAGEIKESIPSEWKVVFLSDHGLMEGKEHNTEAFYSCSEKLFPDRTPRITDFYEEFLEVAS